MHDIQFPSESLEAAELTSVTGGGLLGTAWRGLKGAYHAAKPVIHDAAPFLSTVFRGHTIWHRTRDDR
jgi:hypothetical protein